MSKFIYIWQIWESEKLRVVRNIEQTNNSKICQFFGISIIFQIVKFWKFFNFSNLRISKIWWFSHLIIYGNLGNWIISKIFNISKFGILLNILGVQIISKKRRKKSKTTILWITHLSLFQYSQFWNSEISVVLHLVVRNFDPHPQLGT